MYDSVKMESISRIEMKIFKFWCYLILPGIVKVDLANFVVKFRTKFLNIGFKKNLPTVFLQKSLPNLFELWHDIKKWCFDIHFDVFCVRSPVVVRPCRPPCFRLVLLLIQTTRALEQSPWAVVHSAVWSQSTFQSVSGPEPRRVQGDAGSQSGPLSRSF
jgi:hypothetical protein